MTNRQRLAAGCLALMGLGFVGEGMALADAGGVRPPTPSSPPGRDRPEGQDDVKRPADAADPITGPTNQHRR